MEKEGCSGFKVYFFKVLFFHLKIQERGEIILNLFTRSLTKRPYTSWYQYSIHKIKNWLIIGMSNTHNVTSNPKLSWLNLFEALYGNC